MPKRALIEHRPWLLVSLAAAIAYYFLWNNPIGGIWLILLKGAGVGFLALYAWRRTHDVVPASEWVWIVAFLALSALADMVLELSFEMGGGVFFLAHLAAITLFLRNRRPEPVLSQKLCALGLLIGVPIIAYLLVQEIFAGLYSIGLAAMAASAWISCFSRYRVGIGAVLFVLSDLLIFVREGSLDFGSLPEVLIWPLYYLGQLMIATGVVQTLRGETPVK